MNLVFAVLLAVTQQWLLVSDLHVNPFDRSPRPVSYQDDTNWALFDAAVRQMRERAPHAAVVVIAGDFLAHEFGAKVHAAGANRNVSTEALRTMQHIEHAFSVAFPRAQFLVALGNNDDPCGDYRTAPDSIYRARAARIWAPLVNRSGDAPAFARDFTHAGSYTVQVSKGLRAIVLDDVPWSFVFRGCGPQASAMPQSEMNWFLREIQAVPANQRAVVLMHIPPGIDAATTLLAQRFVVVPFLRDDVTANLTGIMSRNSSRIALAIAGHTHRSDFRVLGGVPMLIAPSISPVYSNNPSFLALQVDPGGTVRDYQMYSFDLFNDSWSSVLDFDRAYGVGAFTAKNLSAVHARIPDDLDLRSRWESGLTGSSPAYSVRQAWRAYWCAQTELRAGYTACAGDQRRVTVLRLVIALLALVFVLGLTLLGMRLARQRRRT